MVKSPSLAHGDSKADTGSERLSSSIPKYSIAVQGGHFNGNFPHYYSFHPFESRVAALLGIPSTCDRLALGKQNKNEAALAGILKYGDNKNGGRKRLLIADWGCNTGRLTRELCRRLRDLSHRPVAGLGLDFDENLINRAKEESVEEEKKEGECGDVSFAAVDLVTDWARAEEIMRAFLDKDGDLGGNDDDSRPRHSRPLESVDGREETRQGRTIKFDLLTIFSTTMWIHLVHGENALETFLRRAAEWTHCLVLEPQTQKSYKAARKRLKRAGFDPAVYFQPVTVADTSAMVMREDGKREWGFTKAINLGASSAWGRELFVYYREERHEEEEEGESDIGDASEKERPRIKDDRGRKRKSEG